ncbi:MAG TPA: DUF2189 domain-containing protein [Alphaproteobacteria bacterium]|nr:DUF2189 domain-containing protein [Alphaproteobacteria bacterium]
MSDAIPVFTTPSPRIHRVPVDRPWTWLGRGWRDMLDAPRPSFSFGIFVAALSILISAVTLSSGLVSLLLPLTAGFFFVAPLLAVGLYEISRRNAAGLATSLEDTVRAVQRNGSQLALMGLVLMLFHLAWIRIATLLFALFFQGTTAVPLDRLVEMLLFSPASLPFLITGAVIGAVLAAIVFAISAISIPMLLDRDTSNVFSAIATSWTAVQVNWPAMALWAALIVMFVLLGFVTFFLGLIVVLPLIGHATWHAYKDMVE